MATAPRATGGRDVVVKPGQPLYITDGDRNFNKVTIEPGGQVFVQTQADITIDTLEKK